MQTSENKREIYAPCFEASKSSGTKNSFMTSISSSSSSSSTDVVTFLKGGDIAAAIFGCVTSVLSASQKSAMAVDLSPKYDQLLRKHR